MHFLTSSLIWLLAGVVLFILEIILPGFVLFFFAVGTWITAAASWLLPLSLNTQLVVFISASLLSLICLRRFIRNTFFGSRTTDGGDSVLARAGEKVEVLVAIEPPAEGRVKYSGSTWRATANEKIAAGEIVTIVQQDGLVMRVRKGNDREG